MKFVKLSRGRKLLVAIVSGIVLMAPTAVFAATGAGGNPQSQVGVKPAATAASDQCVLMKQLNSDEQKYRLTENAPNTYTTTGSAYFNVKCGALTFTVPRGQDSLVDFTSAAELDCQAPNNVTSATPTNGWCEGRFLVNSVNVLPNNGGRSDTFAWDSSNGGSFDWQANTLDQVGHAFCPRSDVTKDPCTYNVQLQARLDNGATSLWVDDMTIRVDVSEGTVTTANVTP